ncbi:MAG: signal peptidase II [Candidatus Pacearchaeota archaeon]|nr:signal peptidase II [Candidatus Pacearchaeota archaeon]
MKKRWSEKEENIRKAIWFLMFISIFVFIFDHVFKISPQEGCFFFICMEYGKNYGAAFSLFSGFPWINLILVTIGLFLLAVVCFFYFKTEEKSLRIALALIFAGTLSNTLDRIFLGYVTDYFTFSFWKNFPTFNIADLTNTAGVILLIVSLLKK